eukprot:TRINITY_DN1003_c0_g1_i1.p1 TRINITY_DN1003_c0_g1~~TRINITY_DN1003_c0_g1_i1.p1  ORF type:complete len:278 (+),score=89.50 TRINITY_DN1003_c0_g1_i1:124-957(+)
MSFTLSAGFESIQGRRVTMEDAHVLLSDINPLFSLPSDQIRAYYGVYDGHGGKNAADMTADLLHENIIKDEDFKQGDIEKALRTGFEKTDKTILDKASKEKWGHGTTAVVCVVVGDSLYIANAGDSEAVIACQSEDGGELSATLLTEKHKPTTASERKRIESAGGQVIFGRVLGSLAVSKALGDMDFKAPYNKAESDFVSASPYVRKYELSRKNPFIVIACDGLWDKVTYDEAVDFVAKEKKAGKDPTETSRLLVNHSLELGSFDNITTIVVYLDWK